jgi:hypothetical protein
MSVTEHQQIVDRWPSTSEATSSSPVNLCSEFAVEATVTEKSKNSRVEAASNSEPGLIADAIKGVVENHFGLKYLKTF